MFVDTRVGALTEAEDLMQAILSGKFSADAVAGDLSDLCAQGASAHGNAAGITLYESSGTALEDVAAAQPITREGSHVEA